MTNTRHTLRRPPAGSPRRTLGTIERPMAVGYGVIGAVLLLGAVGYVVDRAIDTTPWFLIGGLVTGIVVGLALLAASMKRPSSKRHT